MKKKLYAWGFATLMACTPFTAFAATDSIRIGTEGAYPPFNYYTADGELAGFDVDIGNALCAKMDIKCDFVAQDWDGIIPALIAGKYDVIIASMFITDKRKKMVDFSDPYQKSAMTFVLPKDSDISTISPSSLAGKVIGAQGSTTQADFLMEMYPDAEIRLYPTQDAVNLDLVSGRLDAQVGDLIPMHDWTTKTDDGNCCQLAGKLITDRKYVGDGVGMALRQEDDDLRERLNQALAEIIADGSYQKINDKYFSVNLLTLQ
jgi:polar amino acid transport system substrate-binding protein